MESTTLWRFRGTLNRERSRYFLVRTCSNTQRKDAKREPDVLKEEFSCSELLCLCSKSDCCCDRRSKKYKFRNKELVERTLEDCSDGPKAKYCRVLEEVVNVFSTRKGFRAIQHDVTTYEQSEEKLT